MSKPIGRRVGVVCPACGNVTRCENSLQETPEYKSMRAICQNSDCGMVFRASTVFEKVIHPSRLVNSRFSADRIKKAA